MLIQCEVETIQKFLYAFLRHKLCGSKLVLGPLFNLDKLKFAYVKCLKMFFYFSQAYGLVTNMFTFITTYF